MVPLQAGSMGSVSIGHILFLILGSIFIAYVVVMTIRGRPPKFLGLEGDHGRRGSELRTARSETSSADERVFVSYSSRDQTAVTALVVDAERRGLSCWMAPRDVPPGANYQAVIVDAIERADAVALFFSQAAQDSDHVNREISVAQQSGKRIVPLRLDDTELKGAFRYTLSNLHWIDLRGSRILPVPLLEHRRF